MPDPVDPNRARIIPPAGDMDTDTATHRDAGNTAASDENVSVPAVPGREPALPVRESAVIQPPDPGSAFISSDPLAPAPGSGDRRDPTSLFDYADGTIRRPSLERPGYLEGLLRGAEYKPVFGEGKNWFTRGLFDAGNSILEKIGDAASSSLHRLRGGDVAVPITDDLILGLSASGRKIPESELPIDDPRRLGIEELREKHPGALPIWLEGNFGQDLGFELGHTVPLGASGASVRFGIGVEEVLGFQMQRLLFFPGREGQAVAAGHQLARLGLSPTSARDVARMETGATYSFRGSANFRLDAALGFGVAVPAMNELLRVGANVEIGAYASLTGEFGISVQKLEQGRARMTLSSLGSASAGAQLKIFAGVQVNHDQVRRLLRNFVDYVAAGGDPEVFERNLSNERERELAQDLGGYCRLLVKNLADGTGTAVVNHLIDRYASAYLEARGGIDITSSFASGIEFDLESTRLVELPRADMVPEAMRRGVAPEHPLKVKAGDLAHLAYDMAIRGDLRLVQQLTLIRNSGVRIGERTSTTTTGTSSELAIGLPFFEFRSARSTTRTVVDRFTPELGRTRTAISAFNREYRGFFGDALNASAEVRVHCPEGKERAAIFFGSKENLSADLVINNKVEKWTSYADMQNLAGVLNVLSHGRLQGRVREALGQGKYRDDDTLDDLNIIHQLFFKPREYGRSITHLHIWLGEQGLRQLLGADLNEDQLYARIGRVFKNLDPSGGTEQPPWARAGADRRLLRERDPHAHRSVVLADRVGPWDHDLKTARYLVDHILELRSALHAARTPEQEEVAAEKIRDFLRDAKNKLPAYAALASLVPEQHRAVEMRLTALRKGEVPIRFTFIQDGRTSEILHATGFARMAMQQYQRYHAVLDLETRLRVANLLGEVHNVLNSPSPDPYRLKVAMGALNTELSHLDQRAAEMAGRIAGDIGQGRAFLDGLPDVNMIQAVMPGDLGRELATIRLNTLRLLNAPEPDLLLLRASFQSLLAKMPYYRRIQAVAPLLQSVAHLANELAKSHQALAEKAVEAVGMVRNILREARSDAELEVAQEKLTTIHGHLLDTAGKAAGRDSSIVEAENRPRTSTASEGVPTRPTDLAAARSEAAKRYAALAGDPRVAPLSYFERTKVVPPHFMGMPYESGGEGVVTGSMIREAELAMANSLPTGDLSLPPLSAASQEKLWALARAEDAKGFLEAAEALSFRPARMIEDPGRKVVEYFLSGIPVDQRRTFLAHFSSARRATLKGIFAEYDTPDARQRLRSEVYGTERQDFLRENPHYDEDLAYLLQVLAEDPSNLETVLDTLGYGPILDGWLLPTTSRMEGVFAKLSGDELNALVDKMDKGERARFLNLLGSSDLTPQTRAKLAGQVVDNTFFWRQEEALVEALVTGMNAGDLRIFFDQLHVDGKLEDFLSAGSFWQTLLVILTFGLARLWTHDNEAALRVVAAQGWSVDELMAEYDAKPNFTDRIERRAERIFFDATLNTIPMDSAIRGSLRVVHTLMGNVKYYHFRELPAEAARMLREMAKGAGRQLVGRVVDIARQGGSPMALAQEYERFFAGLSPQAIAEQLGSGDVDGSAAVVAKALADGAVAGLIQSAMDPRNKLITVEVLMEVIKATNKLDSPIRIREGLDDPRVEPQDYEELKRKADFFSQYTGFDFSQVQILYGGFAVVANAVAFGPTVSIAPGRAPMVDGKITMSDSFQQVIAFHETVHTLQQLIYGSRVNAFIDQGFYICSSGDRGGAYRVTQEMFDRADSIHDFQDHWEQQAELLEKTLRLMWSRARASGSTSPAVFEAYPGPGHTLAVGGGRIELTPARWRKMVGFLREYGDAAKKALARSNGQWVFTPSRGRV